MGSAGKTGFDLCLSAIQGQGWGEGGYSRREGYLMGLVDGQKEGSGKRGKPGKKEPERGRETSGKKQNQKQTDGLLKYIRLCALSMATSLICECTNLSPSAIVGFGWS